MSNYAIWWFVQPSHLLLFSLGVGAMFARRHWGRRLLIASAAALLVAAFTPLSELLAGYLEERYPFPSQLGEIEGIIVLAGAEQPVAFALRETPHFNEFADRLTNAIALARRNPRARLVHAGRGTTPSSIGQTQSSTAAELFRAAGIEAQRIVMENQSRNTHQSAVEVSRLNLVQPEEDWLLVTSALHMPRAMASFRAQGLDPIAYPVDYVTLPEGFQPMTAARRLLVLDMAAHEYVGLLYYRLRGYVQ